MKKDFISIKDLTEKDIQEIFILTDRLKKDKLKFRNILKGKVLALVFQKPSNRTRVSFEVGMYQLGGYTIYLGPQEINLGVREPIKDVARTLSRYVDAIVLRTFAHKNVVEMAEYADIPVINGLSDFLHPCQALSDIYTIREKKKTLKGLLLAFVGDGNNVCNSLLYASAKTGLNMHVAVPLGYEPDKNVLEEAKRIAHSKNASIKLFYSPEKAVKNADILYTDVWISMGQEKEKEIRKKRFKNFQLNSSLVRLAKKDALIMHCLPAHRNEEITEEVIEAKNSIVFEQAENRLHVQKAILIKLLR
ncbi:MAG: ornithine carbamoyltransferase [Candidatus Omnitrophica bacterium]|nr:ornithine carbamoyltransferase [Candidatus Omnitrophota bacterium]